MACTSAYVSVLLLTYITWDGYHKINIVIADGVNLFPLEVLDERK